MYLSKEAIVEVFGEALYRESVRLIRGRNPREIHTGKTEADLLPHDVGDLVWYSDGPLHEKIQLFFELYEEFPCYAYVLYAKHFYGDFSRNERDNFWNNVAHHMSSSADAIAWPLEYSLWCDYFEDSETVAGAWESLVPRLNPRGLKRLLEISGPVPYRLKSQTYEQLAANRSYHQALARGLFASLVDVYGNLDKKHAHRLLGRLVLVEDEMVRRLKEALHS